MNTSSFAQLHEFYNKNGQLKIDSSFQVSDYSNIPKFTDFGGIQNSLVYGLIQNVDIPNIWMDSGLSGLVIAEIHIKKDTTCNYCEKRGKASKVDLIKSPDTSENDILEYFDFIYEGTFIFPEKFSDGSDYKLYIPV